MTYNECKAIAELDLEPIKVKLMHKESGEGWTLEQATAVEAEYRRFLYLMKTYPHEAAAPLMDVDIFWHYHILDTLKYARDCDAVFGYFLHHFPYVGLRGEDDLSAHEQMGDRMRELYEATFDEKYRAQPSNAAAQATAYSSAPATAYSSAPAQPGKHSTLETAYSSAPAVAYSSAPAQPGKHGMRATAYSSAPAIAYSSAPAQPGRHELLGTAYSSAPAVAYSSAPAQPGKHGMMATAYSSAPAVAYSSAPARPDKEMLATAYSSAPAVAYSSAPAQPARSSQIVLSPSSQVAYSSAPAQPTGRDELGMKKLGPAMAEFFSIRPRLESPAFA